MEVKQVALDFSKATPADYERLKKEITGLEIGVLYNNVGVSYDSAEVLQDLSEEKVKTNQTIVAFWSFVACF